MKFFSGSSCSKLNSNSRYLTSGYICKFFLFLFWKENDSRTSWNSLEIRQMSKGLLHLYVHGYSIV